MKNLRHKISSNLEEIILTSIGNTAIKITNKSVGKCLVFGLHEPAIPMEVLENSEINDKY